MGLRAEDVERMTLREARGAEREVKRLREELGGRRWVRAALAMASAPARGGDGGGGGRGDVNVAGAGGDAGLSDNDNDDNKGGERLTRMMGI